MTEPYFKRMTSLLFIVYPTMIAFLREAVYGVFTIGMCVGVRVDLANPRL